MGPKRGPERLTHVSGPHHQEGQIKTAGPVSLRESAHGRPTERNERTNPRNDRDHGHSV